MPDKISTGAKKGAQKYQNAFAYTHNRGSKTTKKILALPVGGLCKRCTDQILWRKQYRKYKPLTAVKKCVRCSQKKVNKAYHVICDDCAQERGVCAKCLEAHEIVEGVNGRTAQEELRDEQELQRRLGALRERQRRSCLRKLERGEMQPEDVPEAGGSDSDFAFTDDEDEDEDEGDDSEDDDSEGDDAEEDAGKKGRQ
ncbi:hypothetical protein LPJ53_000988 [Coemansia erecta]|uniref:Uncharacterized protein n=1 Tax=Coemansia erecta TaxID=147472 RepID=A0A9W8CUK6_9FUNG|nr:hypothetical protein LPJ53_000988 [Coemansia erecta]